MKIFLTFLQLVAMALSAKAYGPEGHKIIGGIADYRLAGTPAGARVTELLNGYTLEEVSIIADTIKQWDEPGIDDPKMERYFSSHPKIATQLRDFWKANPASRDPRSTAPSHHWFHYTDVPLVRGEKYGDGKIGRRQWDIVHAMRYCIEVLEGKIEETNERKITRPIAIILLSHLVGDIHQPLHVGSQYFDVKGHPTNPGKGSDALSDRGGNLLRLKLFGAAPRKHDQNFHAFWDVNVVLANLSSLPEAKQKALVTQLARTEPKNWSSNESVEKLAETWANEILPLAREAHTRLHYKNVTRKFDHGKMVAEGEIVEKGGDNSVPYGRWAAARALAEIHKAGWQLADLLSRTLLPNDSTISPGAPPAGR